MQESESACRRNLFQITAIRQPHAEALLANEWVRKVNRIRNRIDICAIDGYEFITLAQLDLAHDPEIRARFALPPNPGLLNHLDKRTGAAVQNGQLKIVQLDDGVVDANADKGRKQVFGGGDEHTLLHEAGGVTDAGHAASAGFDREAVEVGAVEHDSRSGTRGQNPQADRSAAVETDSCACYWGTNCFLVCQGGRRVRLWVCISLPRKAKFCVWQKSQSSWFVSPGQR